MAMTHKKYETILHQVVTDDNLSRDAKGVFQFFIAALQQNEISLTTKQIINQTSQPSAVTINALIELENAGLIHGQQTARDTFWQLDQQVFE